MLMLVTLADCAVIQRLNYGTVFTHQGTLHASAEHWKHTFVLDFKLPNFTLLNNQIVSTQSENIHGIYELYSNTISYVTDTIAHIERLVPSHQPTINRKRRSLLPFIGTISKGLFGLATSDDVQNIASRVNALIQKSTNLGHGFAKDSEILHSFIKHTDHRFTNILDLIATNHNFIYNISGQISNNFNQMQRQHSLIINSLTKLLQHHYILKQSYDQLLQGTQSLTLGLLSETILPLPVLTNALNNISHTLQQKGYMLPSTNPLLYYKNARFDYFRYNNTLYITVHFPIIHPSMTLQLFEIISHPVPINSSSSHASKIANLPKHVAISSNHAHFVELNEGTIASCTQFGSTKLCSVSLPLTPISLETCSVSLLLANTSSINKNCEFDFHLNQMTPTITALNDTHFLLFNTSQLTLQCPRQEPNYYRLPILSYYYSL